MHFNPGTYLRYLFTAPEERTNILLSTLNKDPFFSSIIHALKQCRYKIDSSLSWHTGSYEPFLIHTKHEDIPDDRHIILQSTPSYTAVFKIPAKHGIGQSLHILMHELIHFYQDIHGLFWIPILRDQTIDMLDEASFIKVYLHCEAMAQTEAIRGAWRLKNLGYPHSFHGALWSPDWHRLTRHYQSVLIHKKEETYAAQDLFQKWYTHKNKSYYEKRAKRVYTNILDIIHKKHLQDSVRIIPLPDAYTKDMIPKNDHAHLLYMIELG